MADLEDFENFETISNDDKAWVRFDVPDEGDLCVYRRCPECGRYLKIGKITYGRKTTGWICKVHGDVEPFFLID